MSFVIYPFLHKPSSTFTYVGVDSSTQQCCVIDPVVDFDYHTGYAHYHSVDVILSFIKEEQFQVEWILETHAHADHLSAAPYIRQRMGGKIAIGAQIKQVQKKFKAIYHLSDEEVSEQGLEFDHLFEDGESFMIGEVAAKVIYTPGHTPDGITYIMEDMAFVGDTLFMPDSGSARCDFPGGSAEELYTSIQKILSLGDHMTLFMCHDYGCSGQRAKQCKTSVKEQKEKNIHIAEGTTKSNFVKVRQARDRTLSMPRLIIPSIQVNIRAGALPKPEDNNVSYLKVPLNTL